MADKEAKEVLLLAVQCKASDNVNVNPVNEMPEKLHLES